MARAGSGFANGHMSNIGWFGPVDQRKMAFYGCRCPGNPGCVLALDTGPIMSRTVLGYAFIGTIHPGLGTLVIAVEHVNAS